MSPEPGEDEASEDQRVVGNDPPNRPVGSAVFKLASEDDPRTFDRYLWTQPGTEALHKEEPDGW